MLTNLLKKLFDTKKSYLRAIMKELYNSKNITQNLLKRRLGV